MCVGCNQNPDTSSGSAADSQNLSSGNAKSTESERNTSTAVKPDNTGANARDRADATLTPGDQGETQSDLDLTRRIRRTLTSNDQLSSLAKNIKIITQNGKVTLRGPVNTAQERQSIESLAKAQAGGATIDNQLEIKPSNQ